MLKTPSETYIEMNMPGGVIILKKYGIELAMAWSAASEFLYSFQGSSTDCRKYEQI